MAPPPLGKDNDGARAGSILAEGTLVCVACGGGAGGAAMVWIESVSPGLGLAVTPAEPPGDQTLGQLSRRRGPR